MTFEIWQVCSPLFFIETSAVLKSVSIMFRVTLTVTGFVFSPSSAFMKPGNKLALTHYRFTRLEVKRLFEWVFLVRWLK